MTREREVNNRKYFLVGDPRARSKILVGGVFPFSALAASGRICVIGLVLRSVSVDRPRERVIGSVMWCLRQESTRLLPNQSNYVQYGVIIFIRGDGEKTTILRGFWKENRGHFTQHLGYHGRSQFRLSVTSFLSTCTPYLHKDARYVNQRASV